MNQIEKTAEIVSIRRVGERVFLDLLLIEPSLARAPPHTLKPEEVIQPLPKTETERMTRESTRVMLDELKRKGVPLTSPQVGVQIPTLPRLSLSLSKEEYEKMGAPTVYNELKLTIEIKNTPK